MIDSRFFTDLNPFQKRFQKRIYPPILPDETWRQKNQITIRNITPPLNIMNCKRYTRFSGRQKAFIKFI